MDFKNIPKQFRPIPFWSLNSELNVEETKRQVRIMDEAGIGGFFMHARPGLKTKYMSDDWYDNITCATNEGVLRGMYPFAYDENGWPSGFGNGAVNGRGINYQQKFIRMSDKEVSDCLIAKNGEHWFYYDVNPFYVDTLDKKVAKAFLDEIYEPYYAKYKNEICGFFTDEPQISRNGIPWSFVLEDEYKNRYNENISDHLEELFLEVGNYKDTRFKFWKMATDLFSNSFMKQIYDWCDERNLELTGHLVVEDDLEGQITTNGACMPHYEYFHIPGMDWLGRDIKKCLTPMQVSSVAHQLGKGTILSETFAMCGHNVSFDELKGIYEWQMVHGINLLCQHLEGYSLEGLRKRDYPPAMYYQQPWWKDYKIFNDAVSRIGMLLRLGVAKADILLIHPIAKAWTMFNNGLNKGIKELNDELLNVIDKIEQKHLAYHFGDEMIMERHAKVENGRLVIGNQSYSKVVLVADDVLFDNTRALLKEFKTQGGMILSADELEENKVIDCSDITYTSRNFDDFTMHYFVNTSPDSKETKLFVKGERLDVVSGELEDFSGLHKFEPYGSLVIIEKDGKTYKTFEEQEKEYISLDKNLEISDCTFNTLTLDYCDYYFDGELQEKNGFVLNAICRANDLKREVMLKADFSVFVEDVPEKLYLVCETPEKYEIKINGKTLKKQEKGFFRDISFKMLDTENLISKGENIISVSGRFWQKPKVYDDIEKALKFEGEKNKLCYDSEFEAIYLVGNFGVKTDDAKWEKLDKKAERYNGDFVISKMPEMADATAVQRSGFPFFAGSITFTDRIKVETDNPVLKLNRRGVNSVSVEIDGKKKTLLWGADEIPLGDIAGIGEHEIKITLTNNLRNMLGNHHLERGEDLRVGPWQFYKEPCIWNKKSPEKWNDNYCFVEFGI